MTLRIYRQGGLDGLCGIYSVVHAATHLLSVRTPAGYDENLFRTVLANVPKSRFPNVIWEGLGVSELYNIAKKTAEYFRETHDFEIGVSRPFSRKTFTHREDFFQAIDNLWQRKYCVFILWIDWPMRSGGAHWTVLKEIGTEKLRLADSGGVATLPLKRLAVSGNRGTA